MGFAFENESAFECFELAAGLLGWTFDPEKDTRPAKSITLLGNRESCASTGCDDVFIMASTAERVEDLQKAVGAILENRRIS